MRTLGNLIWIIFGGLILSIAWLFVGIIFSITIIGIPFGLQCFKIAELTLAPFGRDIVYRTTGISLLANILWLLFFGIELATLYVVVGIIMMITIVGIPFGIQSFKLALLSLMPFGAVITSK